jgi:hypothetical protein
VSQLLDLFTLGDRLTRDRAIAVGVDTSGRLTTADPRDPARFFGSAYEQLVLHQVSAAAPPRHLALDALWLFDLQVVEQVCDASTLNDPVFLYGTLFGPVTGGSLEAKQGQLAVTRADVLEAFIRSVDHRFGAGARSDGGPVDKSHSLLLPGDSDESLERGDGFILAIPVPPPEFADTQGNGAQVRLVVQQVLAQVQADVDGRKRSVLSKLFVAGPRVAPEPHASTERLVACSRAALALIEGWPAPRVHQLASRVRVSSSAARVQTVAPVLGPLAAAPPRIDLARDDDWMKDFVVAHAKEGRAPEQVSSATPARGRPAWMNDFEAGAPTPSAPNEAPAPSTTPDWMKDFE